MGKSAKKSSNNAAAMAAAISVNNAMAAQQQSIADLRNQAATYEAKTKTAQDQLETLFGSTGKEAADTYTKNFYNTLANITAEYKPKFENFDPNLLGSDSTQRLNKSLRESSAAYKQGVQDVSEQGSARLYQTLATPITAFNALEKNPAFNLQYDPVAMSLATRPPTIRSDVESMKNLYDWGYA